LKVREGGNGGDGGTYQRMGGEEKKMGLRREKTFGLRNGRKRELPVKIPGRMDLRGEWSGSIR